MLETRETARSWLLIETEGGRGGQRRLVVLCLRSHALFCMYEEPLTCPLSESWSGEEVTELRTLACCASAVLSVASCISSSSAAQQSHVSMRASVHELAGGGAWTWQSTEHDGGASCAYGEGEGAGEVGEEGRADALADGRVVARLVVQDARASTDHLCMRRSQPARAGSALSGRVTWHGPGHVYARRGGRRCGRRRARPRGGTPTCSAGPPH